MTISKDGLGEKMYVLHQSQLFEHVKQDVLQFGGNVILSVI